MMKSEKIKALQADSIAYISSCGGVEIKYILHGLDDYAVIVAGAWTGCKTVHRLKINYTAAGVPFIRLHGYTLPLSEAIRI